MNTQYRKNLKDVATACKNYTDKRFEDFKWELGTHTIDTATDSDVAYQKQAPNGTIGCQIENVGGMSYKSENYYPLNEFSNDTKSGITLTKNDNGTLTINGTASAYPQFYMGNITLNAGTYYLPDENLPDVFWWVGTGLNNDNERRNLVNQQALYIKSFTLTETTVCYFTLVCVKDAQFTNTIFYPLCVKDKSNVTISDYTPYFTGIRDSAVTSIVANSTLNIPASIKALSGYGWGINDTCYNYIDFENKKFVQKVGRVDLGSLTWNYTTLGSSNVFTASISNFKSAGYSVLPNILCSLYQVITRQQMEGGSVDFSVCVSGGTPQPLIANSNYSDATTFKTAMSGVYLYYELATPVETDISSYITNNDKFLEVEPLGTITFTNTYEQEVPSEITYLTEVAK